MRSETVVTIKVTGCRNCPLFKQGWFCTHPAAPPSFDQKGRRPMGEDQHPKWCPLPAAPVRYEAGWDR